MFKTIRFLITRPLLVKLILVFILAAAVAQSCNLRRLAYPNVDHEVVVVTTPYPGASPEDVELNVTIKLEEALEELDGIDRFTSASIENASVIWVKLDPDATDKDKVKSEIRRVIDSVSDLPIEAKRPTFFESKEGNYGPYEVALTFPKGDEKKLRHHAQNLKKKLLNLYHVAKVRENGIRDREFQIQLSQKKLEKYQIAFDEIIAAIQNNKIRASGGYIESFTSEKGIVTISEFDDPKDVEKIIVRTSELGAHQITVGDLGKVIDTFEKRRTLMRFNGENGISFNIVNKEKSDIIDTVDEVKKLIDEYKENFAPDGLEIFTASDFTVETKNRLSIVYSNALAGFVLVIIFLFLFLDRKVAFWTAAGIPFSIAITIIVLPFLDVTINAISLCGMVVVLGMLVDDAIIVAESIYRAREEGMDKTEASVYGLKMVIKPVFGTILTTIIAFIPIYFLPGPIGAYSMEVPTIVIIMLLASLIEATLLLPVHLAHSKQYLDKSAVHEPIGQKFIKFLREKYVVILEKALHHKIKALIVMALFLIVGFFILLPTVDFVLIPNDQAYRIFISGNTPRGSSLDFTTKAVKKLEKIVDEIPGNIVTSHKSYVGHKAWSNANVASNLFSVYVELIPATDREMTCLGIKSYIQNKIEKKKIKDFEITSFFIHGGAYLGKPIELHIIGNNNKKRKEVIDTVLEELKELPITDVESDLKEGKDEIRVLPNRSRIAITKLNMAIIASTIRTAIDGTIVTYQQTPAEKIPFRVMLDKASKEFKNPLKGLFIRNYEGRLIPLNPLVHIQKGSAKERIFHYNGDRVNTITADVVKGKATTQYMYTVLSKKFKDFEKRFPGFQMRIGGEAEESQKIMNNMTIAIIMAIIAIYFILLMQFNSMLQPLIIILAIPFGFSGIIMIFLLHGIDLSLVAMIGIAGFSGVVVNDSLIMVDFINRIFRGEIEDPDSINIEQNEDQRLIKAIISGARLRLRPIVLTTITTVAGLIPTAYGLIGGLDSFISPMVMAMAWGLLIGTSATLIVIPVFYLMIFKFTRLVRNILATVKNKVLVLLPFARGG